MRMLSKKGDCWNPEADSRSSGCLAKSCLTVSDVKNTKDMSNLVDGTAFGLMKLES
jgi:hypothetical protein